MTTSKVTNETGILEELRRITSNRNWINEVVDIVRPIMESRTHIKPVPGAYAKELVCELARRGVSKITPDLLTGMYLKRAVKYPYLFGSAIEDKVPVLCTFVEEYPKTFQWFMDHAIYPGIMSALVETRLPFDSLLPEFMRRIRCLHNQGCMPESWLNSLDIPRVLQIVLENYVRCPAGKRWKFLVGLALGASPDNAKKFSGSLRALKTANLLSKQNFDVTKKWHPMHNCLPRICSYGKGSKVGQEAATVAMTALHTALSHPKAALYAPILGELVAQLFMKVSVPRVVPRSFYRSYCPTIVSLVILSLLNVYGDNADLQDKDHVTKGVTLRQVNDLIESNNVMSLLELPLYERDELQLLRETLGRRPLPESDETIDEKPYILCNLQL